MNCRAVHALLLAWCYSHFPIRILGSVVFRTEPLTPRIYVDAKAETYVCTVNAYDADSGEKLTQYKLARTPDADYFTIEENSGVISTSTKVINVPIGQVLNLRVYGVLAGSTFDMNVSIYVSRKNIFPPVFKRDQYSFSVYYLARVSSFIGTVEASDQDSDEYNRNLEYYGHGNNQFIVDKSTGDIFLNEDLPEISIDYDLTVVVSDRGIPPFRSNVSVTIHATLLPAPSDFCNAFTGEKGTVCWKTPNITDAYDGFRFAYGREGEGLENQEFVPVSSIVGDEACALVDRAVIGVSYLFYIWTLNGTDISQRSFPGGFQARDNSERFLLTGENCKFFNVCNLVQPCANGGQCMWSGELQFSCDCAEGWGGQTCLMQDLCATKPCMNNGQCVYLTDQRYECRCEIPYYGTNCEHIDQCDANPCGNGGTCTKTVDGDFDCNCTQLYSGQTCETFDPCLSSPCLQDGTCIKDLEQPGGLTCQCQNGYNGSRCEVSNMCVVRPDICKNGGSCIDLGNSYYFCLCTAEFSGKNCESFNSCVLDICQNNSTCSFVSNNKYKCSCSKGYYGQECQHYNMCADNPCKNGATCRNATNSFTCECARAYYDRLCDRYDPCLDNPCERNGICAVISDSDYNCSCSPETFGKNCSYVNSCKLEVCKNGATCENTTFDGRFLCHCAHGYYGSYCTMYDPCASSPCANGGGCYNVSSQDFTCSCLDGFTGKTCSSLDPCVTNPCFNNGQCKVTSNTTFSCSCHPGFSGEQCQYYDFCIKDPCGVGGLCQLTFDTGEVSLAGDDTTPFKNVSNFFKCLCHEDYTGMFCETALGACLSGPCLNGATCHLESKGFVCLCPSEYTGITCETQLPCFSSPCRNGGYCAEIGDDFYCNCTLGFTGTTCSDEATLRPGKITVGFDVYYQSHVIATGPSLAMFTVTCSSERTQDASGTYVWPSTAYGRRVQLPCELGPSGRYAKRRCGAIDESVKWESPETSECTSKDEGYASAQLKLLKDLTSDPANMGPEDVANVATILEDVVLEFSLKNKQIANDMTEVVSNVMDAKESVLKTSQSRNSSSQRMVGLIDNFTSKAEVQEGKNVTLLTKNIHVVALDTPKNVSDVFFSPRFINGSVEEGSMIVIPSNVIQNSSSTKEGSRQRLEFAAFSTAKLFLDESTEESTDTIVISASIKGRRIENLSEPVVITLPESSPNRNYTCKFWNETGHFWSTDGVYTIPTTENYTECFTYHLTSFAILMDPSPDFKVAAIHETIQTYITYIGCGISMLGLTITIITYGLFKCLHGDKSGKILLNLCVSMLMLNVVFILGSQSGRQYGREICMAVAILIHYFLLTSLMWMCIEAGNMYRVLVTVFTRYTDYFMLKRCVLAWGIPAIIVGITMGVSLSNYETQDEFCFISHANITAFYVAVLAPACAIILIDIVVFVMVSRVIMKPRFTGHINTIDTTITAAQVRGAFTVLVLLGVSWVFGPLAINEAKLVFSYLFCIANAFQGFLIFIFRCFINPEARAAWFQLIRTGTFKRKRGPTVPTTTSSASKGESKANGTLDDSKRNTMVLTGNVWHTDKYIQKSDWDTANGHEHAKLNGHSNGQSNAHSNGHSNGQCNADKHSTTEKSRSNKKHFTKL